MLDAEEAIRVSFAYARAQSVSATVNLHIKQRLIGGDVAYESERHGEVWANNRTKCVRSLAWVKEGNAVAYLETQRQPGLAMFRDLELDNPVLNPLNVEFDPDSPAVLWAMSGPMDDPFRTFKHSPTRFIPDLNDEQDRDLSDISVDDDGLLTGNAFIMGETQSETSEGVLTTRYRHVLTYSDSLTPYAVRTVADQKCGSRKVGAVSSSTIFFFDTNLRWIIPINPDQVSDDHDTLELFWGSRLAERNSEKPTVEFLGIDVGLNGITTN